MKAFFSRAAIAASLAAAALSAPALAQQAHPALTQPAQTFEFTVERARLTSDTDVRRAYQRLESEAQRYCRALDLVDQRTTARCRMEMVSHVVDSAGHNRLAAYHAEQTREGRVIAAAGGR